MPPHLIGLLLSFALVACSDAGATSDPYGPQMDGVADARQLGEDGPGSAGSFLAEGEGPKVLVLGDSIAAGLHLPEDLSFPRVLERRLRDKGTPVRLYNAGESGRTAAGGATVIDWLLKTAKPDVLVVELGANDGLRLLPTDQVEGHLRSIIDKGLASGARVLLLGVRIPKSLGPEYVADFEAIYPRLGALEGVAFHPFFMEGVGGVPEMNLPDGLHPTPEGHERIADNVLPALEAVLASIPPAGAQR